MSAGGPVRRLSRTAAVLCIATVGIAIVGVLAATADAGRASSRTSVTLMPGDALGRGWIAHVLVGDDVDRPVAARVCNTDPRIPPAAACGDAQQATRPGVFDVPLTIGYIALDTRAVCPATQPLNTRDARCVINMLTESGADFAVADVVVADPQAETEEDIKITVRRKGPPGTAGATVPTTPTTPVAPPPTAAGFPPIKTTAIGSDTAGLETPTTSPPLAQTGAQDALAYALVGMALVDLGWVLCAAARPMRFASTHTLSTRHTHATRERKLIFSTQASDRTAP